MLGGVIGKDPELNERKTMAMITLEITKGVLYFFCIHKYLKGEFQIFLIPYPIAPSTYPYTPMAVFKLILAWLLVFL